MQRLYSFAFKTFLLVGFSTLISTISYSQYEPLVNYNIPITEGMIKAAEGTYQITIL